MGTITVPSLEHVNDVHLIGRVSADPVHVTLPSGDQVVTVRIVVDRPRPPAGRGRRAKVDALACAAWTESLRRTVMRWLAADIVEVRGALRRRFWRVSGVPQSRYEIELSSASRLLRPPADLPDDEAADLPDDEAAELSHDQPPDLRDELAES